MRIYTIGHSTRSTEEFIALLKAYHVEVLVDVRMFPRSQHNPQFKAENLKTSLRNEGIGYTRIEALGGFRRPAKDSKNTGWRNSSFRGYADYMATPEFKSGIAALLRLGGERQAAIMCAEAVPWRCHRSLISDALVSRNIQVFHIQNNKASPHKPTPFLRIREDGELTYPELGTLGF